jgi:neutral ceramidase
VTLFPGNRAAPVPLLIGCLLGACALAAGSPARAETLVAGVARVEITPPAGFLLDGYPDPLSARTATGARDPLYARVLVLGVGATRLALVDLDLEDVFGPDTLARLREATRSDVSNLLVDAIHTHSGPPLDSPASSPVGAWYLDAVGRIAAAVHRAAANTVPARIGVGYGVAFIGHNRLRIEHDGGVTWFEKNWTGTSNALVDPTVAVLRVDDMGGSPLAVLVNYACHPVIYGPDSRLYSADFPGVMTGVVEEALGGGAMCFYLQGGAGNINPDYAVSSLAQGAVEFCRSAGTRLGRAAAQVARGIQTTADAEPSLQVAEDAVTLRPRWNARKWLAARPEDAATIDQETRPLYQAPVVTVLINRRIALVALPGEPFVEHQMQWRARCPVPDSLFLGYSSAELDYFPTIRAASWGGYGASHSSTWVEVGAGEEMLDRALIRVFQMLGRLKPTPEDLKP